MEAGWVWVGSGRGLDWGRLGGPAWWACPDSSLTRTLSPSAWAEEQNKLVHGGPCEKTSHPYQAALYTSGHLLCGGVLIHPQWVLTAAHCKKP